ncbi:MAG: hypothetical protein JJT76_10540 [Clostridiaceae bacterium]|nr:hypothetical protein [Clostridiaceae bacterium]
MKDKYIEWLKELGFYPVNEQLWNKIELNHRKPENDLHRKKTEAFLKKSIGTQNGLYVYESLEKKILYVGKGKPIINRVISHYRESFKPVSGDTKDKRWHRFFKTNSGTVRVYWKELEGESERKVVEKMLDIILNPKFNEFDSKYQSKVEIELTHAVATPKVELDNESIDYSFGDHREEIINKIGCKLGSIFTPKYNKTGVTFVGSKGRILKVVKRKKNLEVEFNVPVTKLPGVIILNDKEAIEKKMGTCRWIYKGDNLHIVLKLVEEAKNNY